MNTKHELCPRTKESPQTSPEKTARQGKQRRGALRTLIRKPEPQTNVGPIWFLALLSERFPTALRTYSPTPYSCHGDALQPT